MNELRGEEQKSRREEAKEEHKEPTAMPKQKTMVNPNQIKFQIFFN